MFSQTPARGTSNRVGAMTVVISALMISACGGMQGVPVSGSAALQVGSPDEFTYQTDEANQSRAPWWRSRLIAADFATTMLQIPALEPQALTLSTQAPVSRFGELLLARLQEAGYDLRIVGDERATTLQYRVLAESVTSRGTLTPTSRKGTLGQRELFTFIITAGPVKLKRTYRVNATSVRPATSMFLQGANPEGLKLNSSLFDNLPSDGSQPLPQEPTTPSDLLQPAQPQVASSTGGATTAREFRPDPPQLAFTRSAVTQPRVVARKLPGSQLTGPANAVSSTGSSRISIVKSAPEAKTVELSNMYETGVSRYADSLDRFDTLSQHIMVFPDDSLMMGSHNKQLARRLVEQFDPSRDVISVIGCSHGVTALPDGNQSLANGRSFRVKEEFVLSGVEAALVLEEGCWANRPFDSMPARGVVVTHKRRGSARTGQADS